MGIDSMAKARSFSRPTRIGQKESRILIFAIALSLTSFVCTFMVRSGRDHEARNKSAASGTQRHQFPVPTRAVAKGERLMGVPFVFQEFGEEFAAREPLKDLNFAADLYAATALSAYTPINRSSLSEKPLDRNVVVERIPEGMRAITVKVDVESAVEGWARSGNSVDVILIESNAREGSPFRSTIIAENVTILSAESSALPLDSDERAPKAPSSVTLLTTQEDALRIKTASHIGRLTFALRGNGDELPASSHTFNGKRLLASTSSDALKNNIEGYARGPDGKTYVLRKHAAWIRTSGALANDRSLQETLTHVEQISRETDSPPVATRSKP